MLKRIDIENLLNLLNERLANENETRELVVCRGAALILNNYKKEETADIDILSSDKDELLKRLSLEIAKKNLGLRSDWLNSNAASFFKRHNPLPVGWEKRLVQSFKASHLTVKSLSEEDMLFSKICSHIDREMDEADMKELARTKELFENTVRKIVKLKKFQDTASTLIIGELRVRLGFDDDDQ